MASKNTETDAGNDGEPKEHDYAEAASSSTSSSSAPAADGVTELPEPAVGAEVDCPGGSNVDGASSELPARSSVVLRGRRRPKRPEDKNCSCCKAEFQRKGRSFNRRAVGTFTTAETVQWAFPEAVVHDSSFLCETCVQIIRSMCERKPGGRKALWVKPPAVKKVRDGINAHFSVYSWVQSLLHAT